MQKTYKRNLLISLVNNQTNQPETFGDVGLMCKRAAELLECDASDLNCEIANATETQVKVWIWTGEFKMDTAIHACVDPETARFWEIAPTIFGNPN